MKYFVGHEIPKYKLYKVIGNPIQSGVRGTTTYFIKEIFSDTYPDIDTLSGGKGIFQLFDKGILFRVFKSAKTYSIAISFSEVQKILLNEGQHRINPVFLSPFWIALNLGMSLNCARYFAQKWKEYEKDPTVLEIKAGDFSCRLTSNGYSYQSEERFFKKLSTEKVEIKRLLPTMAKKHTGDTL